MKRLAQVPIFLILAIGLALFFENIPRGSYVKTVSETPCISAPSNALVSCSPEYAMHKFNKRGFPFISNESPSNQNDLQEGENLVTRDYNTQKWLMDVAAAIILASIATFFIGNWNLWGTHANSRH